MRGSLRSKLLIGFLTFSLISVFIIVPSSNYYFAKKENISEIIHKTDKINKHILQDFRILTDFFRYEISNPQFFIKERSTYLKKHENQFRKINNEINTLLNNEDLHYLGIREEIKTLQSHYSDYQNTINNIVELILKRGFEDYGTVGTMRKFIHKLEDYKNIDQTQVLSLRRHEKDYIIRHQEQYIKKLNQRAENFKKQIANNMHLSSNEKANAIHLLNNYVKKFNQIVSYDRCIGFYNNTGLKNKLESKEKQIEEQFIQMINKSVKRKEEVYARLKYYYIAFFLIIVTLIVLTSIHSSKRITNPLVNLSSYISEFVKNGFKHPKKLQIPNQKDEIANLYKELDNLIQQLDKRENEKNEARENLKENEIHFRELANMLPQCVFETDSLGNFTYVNKAWVEIFGYTKKDIKAGLNITETIISEGINREEGEYKIGEHEYLARRKDGSTFSALVYTNKVIRNNAIAGKRGIIIDNTQRKNYLEALEKAKQKAETSDKLKSSFLANMSHEIRTPVHAILGFSDLLREEYENPDKQKEYVDIIRESSQDLLTLINDIIDVAKIEAGEINIEKTNCYLNYLLEGVHKKFQAILKQKGKDHIEMKLNKGINDDYFKLKTDQARLKQVLNNLLNNAIKFTENGSIEFGYTVKDNTHLLFYVKDTGIGISKNQLNVIFERFRQADLSKTREYGGTGLGLTISKSFVELFEGKIWAKSEPNKGSTFYFTHPINNEINLQEILPEKYTIRHI